jgi:glyoxylase-like metal-dependent hydrolase (beta-lactamase superfamily II)
MQKITKDIYIETKFPGVTVGAIVGPEGVICIDAPTYPADARSWRQQVEAVAGKPVRFVINLDHHRDRILGNQWFEAPVVAQEQAYERMRQLPDWFKNSSPEPGSDSEGVTDLSSLRVTLPQLTFGDTLTLMVGKHALHLRHKIGVNAGACWVELPAEGVVFTGDSVTNKVPPILHDADLDRWLADLAELKKQKSFKHIVPGRGGLIKREGLKPLEDTLKLAQRKIETLVKSKKTRAELDAVARDLLSKFTVPTDQRQHYQRRMRAGLDHLFDRRLSGATR